MNGILTAEKYRNLSKLYGPCQIDVPYKGVLRILREDVLTPFYIFQVSFTFILDRQHHPLDVLLILLLCCCHHSHDHRLSYR